VPQIKSGRSASKPARAREEKKIKKKQVKEDHAVVLVTKQVQRERGTRVGSRDETDSEFNSDEVASLTELFIFKIMGT